jgi:hypothetical protein
LPLEAAVKKSPAKITCKFPNKTDELNSLSRFLENEENCVHLFSRNIDVDIHNYTKIQTVAGELKIYKSVDEGSNYYLDKCLAPKNVGLKVGCFTKLQG